MKSRTIGAAPLLIHPIGGGDIGRPPMATSPGPVDYHGDRDNRRPLRKVFDGLTATGTDISGLLIVATTNLHAPTREPFVVHAQRMQELLCSADGLCGRTLPQEQLHIAQVVEPNVEQSVEPLKSVLAGLNPGECLLTSGSGSYALGAGVLLAGIETGVPITLLPVDDPSAAYRLHDLIDPHDTLCNWLLRHRFWDEMATVDPANADLWRLLAARQRADISLAQATTARPGLDQGTLTKLRELWPAVQAAFYERLGRGEAVDHSLLRTWFVHRISSPSRKEAAAVSEADRRVIDDLAGKLDDPKTRGGASRIERARRALPPVPRTLHAALIGDVEFIRFFEESASHRAHLDPPGPRRLPGSLLANADRWEGSDPVPGLVKQRGMTVWPVLGTGDLLVLMCVGMVARNDPNDRAGHAALREAIDWASRRLGTLARPGRIRLRLLASAETMDRARSWTTLAQSTAPAGSLDAAVLGPFSTEPSAAEEISTELLAELAKARPNGLHTSTSLRDVDEILLVINSGKPVTVNGMIAAAVQWSLNAACPLRVAELVRDRALRTVINEADLTLCRLGMDAHLARLASAAVHRLDTRTAWALLANGSPALTPARDAAAAFHHALYGHPEPTTDGDARCALACRRLELIARVLADEPWPACYTAVEVLRPGIFYWDTWKALTQRFAPLGRLNNYRNESPYAHLLGRLREGERQSPHKNRKRPLSKVPPPPDKILQTLHDSVGVFQQLRSPNNRRTDPDLALITRYTNLCGQLDRLGESAR